MNKELTAKLNADYPEIFLFHNFRAANCFSFECGDGWYNILNTMFRTIHNYVKANNDKVNQFEEAQDMIDNGFKDQVPDYMLNRMEAINNGNGEYPELMDYPVAQQIKEKFGTMRVYMSGCDKVMAQLTHFAESMSDTTCEDCGNIGKLRSGSWVKTLCDEHEVERQKGIKEREAQFESFQNSMVDRK